MMEEKDICDCFSISVMHVVNTGKLWVSEPSGKDMSAQRRILQQLEENLSQLMSRTFEMPSNLPVNKLIAVKHDVTGCWHRGELLSPRPTSSSCRVRVFLVDHGAILVDVQPKHLQILPQEMHELPKQAFVVCLYGLIPISMTVHLEDTRDKMHYEECGKWTPASEALVRKCIKYATSAHLRVMVCRGHVVHGEVIVNSPGEGYVSLNKILVKNNFAIYSEDKYKKVIEREAKLEERLIAKILEVNEIEERCSTSPKISLEKKPILMEDFLKEYANKKILMQEKNFQFLDSARYKKEMRGCHLDDEKTREAMKNSIFTSRVKTSGRGENLSMVKNKKPVISVGRGLPLIMDRENPSASQREDYQRQESSKLYNLLDILSKRETENLEESTNYQRDSSVLSLGRIPAGQFQIFDHKLMRTMAVTRKKKNNGSSCRKRSTKSPDHEENIGQLRGTDLDASIENYFFVDPESLIESKKAHSSKDSSVNVSFMERETGSSTEEISKEIVTATKSIVSSVAPSNKIMKLLLSLNRNSEEEKPDTITKNVDVSHPKKDSTMHLDISYKMPSEINSSCEGSNVNSMGLKSQPLKCNDLGKENPILINASLCDENQVKNMESSKKKNISTFQAFFGALKKKNKSNRDEEPCTNAPASGTIQPVFNNKQPDSTRVKDSETSLLSNVNHPHVPSFFKRRSELVELQLPEKLTNSTSSNSKILDGSNDTKKDREIRDRINATVVLEDSCPKASSDPEQLKAALDLISSFISNIEANDSDKPPVDLIRLQRELNTFSQHVFSKKTNKLNVTGNKISTIFSDKLEERPEEDSSVNDNAYLNGEKSTLDHIKSFNPHPEIPTMEKTKFSSDGELSEEKEEEEMFKETQEEPAEIIELPNHIDISCKIKDVAESLKLDDTVKGKLMLKHDESPKSPSNIEQPLLDESQPFSLLNFFPEKKCTTRGEGIIINHEKPSSSVPKHEVSPGLSKGIVLNKEPSREKATFEAFLSSKNDERRLDITEDFGVQELEKNISKDINDTNEINDGDTSASLGKNTHESGPLNDDHVSKNISSCSKIFQKIEQMEKVKCLQTIKDEGIPMEKLSARLPAFAAQNILKSKGSSPVSFTSNGSNPSNSTLVEDSVISKQKNLEPQVITRSVRKDDLPSLLKDSWLSKYSNDDYLFTEKRQKMCRVLVRGCFLAQRITSIAQATFPKSLHQALANMRYRDPMRIQTYAWPALMRGHDLVMVNPPRSGKTLGYLVPLLGFMLSPELYSELPAGNGPLVLIICPSWKVVSQVCEFCESLLSTIKSCVKVIPVYGGIEAEQTISLINGCHVLISTPRCFLRLLKQDRITTNLERLCHLVFDEADTLMKLFFPEIKEILRECRLILQRRARISAETNPSEGAASYTMVKLIAASKSWCPQMESFVTNIIDKPVIFIGSYLEAAVYAQLKPKLHLVGFGVNKERSEQEKINSSERINLEIDDIVLHLIKRRVGLYKIVIACESKTEALQLASKISALAAHILIIHEDVLHVDIAEALNTWTYSKQPGAYPVLIVTDGALPEVNIGDAEHLIHVGIPSSSKTQFGLRFSTLMDNYRDVLDKAPDGTKSNKNCFVDIIVDINKPDLEISGLVEFMQRLGMEIPMELQAAATKSLLNKESVKKKDIELCPNLKSFGECSASSCNFRHIISPELDKPKDMPQSGEVCFKVLQVLDASHMSVRLLEHINNNGHKTEYPNEYYVVAAQMARYFGKSQNQAAHGYPKVGDLCAYETEINLFHRARVEKVIYDDSKLKIPVGAFINLIDMGIKVNARVPQLFYLPDDLKEYPEQAKELIVANMLPRDLDSSWSKAACVKVAEWIEEGSKGESNGKIIIGKIVLALGNTVWVDPLECREWLTNNKTNVIHLSLPLNLCQAGLAIKNPDHIKKIKQICEGGGMLLNLETSSKEDGVIAQSPINEMESPKTKAESDVKILMEWETLDHDKIVEVQVVDVVSPSIFTVQKVEAEENLKDLMEEIQSWISDVWQKSPSNNICETREYSNNSFCLGYYERDKCWNRAKIISLLKTSPSVITNYSMEPEVVNVEKEKLVQYQLYFLDFGDSVTVSSSEIAPIPENFISKLPFQAIECSLFGVKPINKKSDNDNCSDFTEDWDEEVGDALFALCREGEDLDIYQILLAKVFESAGEGKYGGPKYSVALYNKGNEGPISLSKLLVEKGMAISCKTDSENEVDNELTEVTEELDLHWMGEGALLPFTQSLSTASEVGSETQTVGNSGDIFAAAAKSTNPTSSETPLLLSNEVDDDDDDSYDIVMSEDELKIYEERFCSLFGIPPHPHGIKKTEEPCLAIESSATMEDTSSFEMVSYEDRSSLTSFEDLGDCYKQESDRFEEILEERPVDMNKPERIVEGESGNDVEVLTEHYESVDTQESMNVDRLKCGSELGKENKDDLEESCLSVQTDGKKDEDFREESGCGDPCSEKSNFDLPLEVDVEGCKLDDICFKIKNSTLIGDNLSQTQLDSIVSVNSNDGISEKDEVECPSKSDLPLCSNETKIGSSEIGVKVKDISAHILDSSTGDLLNVEDKVNVCNNEHVCDNIAVGGKSDEEMAVNENIVSRVLVETMVEDELTNTKESADSLKGENVQLSSKSSEVITVEEDGTAIADPTEECSIAIKEIAVQEVDENQQVELAYNREKNLKIDENEKEVGKRDSFDFRRLSNDLESLDVEGSVPSKIISETENVSEVLKEENDEKKDVNASLDITDITNEISDCSNEGSCVHMPGLMKAKTPSVKWAQTKKEIILTIDVPYMTTYQVHWKTNRKLEFFAITDTDVISRYALEMELWGYVDSQNSQIAAISDNAVKMILYKALTCMEWPHLLLSGIRPLWLSVDFEAMEFDTEERFEEDPVPTIKYNVSDEDFATDDDADSVDGQRVEEINYDPYDPLS